ncbi:hypothetical protein TRFO_29665 [Tritrichomonas foetus]|uniref:UDENN domain-containing protein n=1 Tax=Tritrichomonas foetus TaxID=1144522 RepID=A0A1J4JZX9_9EUKA|nr:hypothetical protein TRFO_29665 [Tritrichomonas foetus]|eukprot:OHT03046.1 hypothetical protein TRFO_29665 [Tritrichomonas foetus]
MNIRERYDSFNLRKRFNHRFQMRADSSHGDDALKLDRRNSDQFDTLFESLFLIGSFPWENEDDKRILFKYPSINENDNSIVPFCFPTDNNFFIEKIHSNEFYKTHLIDDNNIHNSKFFPLYFPSDEDSPYVFCLSFYASIFNLPSFIDEFEFSDALSYFKKDGHLIHSRLCLCVKTKLPFHSLFHSFLIWILRCEIIGRMTVFADVCDFFATNSFDISNNFWPLQHKNELLTILMNFSAYPVPFPNETLVIDKRPFPPFSWKRPDDSMTIFPIAKIASIHLLSNINIDNFKKLFFSVLLEKTIIIYSKDIEDISWLILTLHYLIRPLKWVSVSVSLLPKQLYELLDAPNPIIAGVTDNLFDLSNSASKFDDTKDETNINPTNFFFYDTQKQHILYNYEIPLAPQESIFSDDISRCWKSSTSFTSILTLSNHFVSTILKVIDSCIMSNISDIENPSSIFMEELFLQNFPIQERPFLSLMASTQMFQFFVEQQCLKRSKRNSIKRKQ